MMMDTVTWHHGTIINGTIGESCSSDGPTQVSKLGKKRLEHRQLAGPASPAAGFTMAVFADCPKCGRWIRIGTKEGE